MSSSRAGGLPITIRSIAVIFRRCRRACTALQTTRVDTSLFDSVKVLDLSERIAGPFCARLLADFGADVLKVEAPEGDSDRRLAPFAGSDARATSLPFLLLNLNKRGI